MIFELMGRNLSVQQRTLLIRRIIFDQKEQESLDSFFDIEIIEKIRKKQYSSLWYGGEIARIRYKGCTFDLHACGDVRAILTRKGEPDDELLYVKDKNNAGVLRKELLPYVRTDRALYAAINGQHEKYHLELLNNNWYECFVTDPSGQFHDLMWALNSDHALEAIAEVVCGMDEVIADAEKETG